MNHKRSLTDRVFEFFVAAAFWFALLIIVSSVVYRALRIVWEAINQ